MSRVFRIHPAVGIARVGHPESEFFIGPEQPGVAPNPAPATGRVLPFKDAQGRVKRQAARFRVWEYEGCCGLLYPKREITLSTANIVAIRWTVHLANRKASCFQFDGQDGTTGKWFDPGPRIISGVRQSSVRFDNPNPEIPIKFLGELRTDEAGHLLVLGGHVNNDTWLGDMADGPVSAVIVVRNENGYAEEIAADPAWCLVGPPDFASSVANIVRLSDTMWDVAVRKLPLSPDNGTFLQGRLAELKAQKEDWNEATKSFKNYKPSFKREIQPLLERALLARQVHNPDSTGTKVDPKQMPKALGDEAFTGKSTQFMSLTHVQYALLRQWKDGKFLEDWDGKPEAPPTPGVFTPEGLDFAALDNCAGGPFFPGIDVSWLIRHENVYAEPFRIKHGARVFPDLMPIGPGFFSQQMALPWQADFYPSEKLGPERLEQDAQRQKNGSTLGFILKEGEEYFEAKVGESVK
ncbi:hypothetical protein F0U60_41430 [Archangium minus]|uniref:Lysine-epsilon oxidase n=1 Tax=Archangium minus TaxID=83450 RepID=A0ABY9X381_9BACT|nr:hypothetical protein F0U60_41430 [Archangium minus]